MHRLCWRSTIVAYFTYVFVGSHNSLTWIIILTSKLFVFMHTQHIRQTHSFQMIVNYRRYGTLISGIPSFNSSIRYSNEFWSIRLRESLSMALDFEGKQLIKQFKKISCCGLDGQNWCHTYEYIHMKIFYTQYSLLVLPIASLNGMLTIVIVSVLRINSKNLCLCSWWEKLRMLCC